VLNLVLKSGDLGGKPVDRNFQVANYPGEYIGFNLSCDSGGLLLVQIRFQVGKGLCFRARSIGNDSKPGVDVYILENKS
jgi:hypothetical protein